MESVFATKTIFFKEGQAVICPVVPNYVYEVLDPSDQNALDGATECLADTFTGIIIDGVKIYEPMTNACSLSRNAMFDFVQEYLEGVAHQRLSFIARDKKTGEVVGALACEDYNPDEEIPRFSGNLEPMNIIIPFLLELDERFTDNIYRKTGKKVSKGEYIHTFMAGVKLGSLKRFVAIKLLEMMIAEGCRRGYKGTFGEATNFKSIKMMVDYCGFHPVYDLSGDFIKSMYAKHDVFKAIHPKIATDCRILYRPLFTEYDI